MNDVLVSDWNKTVKPEDTVYFLGDLTFGKGRRPHKYWLDQLNGNIIFIKGSHDYEHREGETGITVCTNLVVEEFPNVVFHDSLIIRYGNTRFLLVHDPDDIPSTWTGWVIHGHHHNNYPTEFPLVNFGAKRINISVELIGYKPISATIILQLMRDNSHGNILRISRDGQLRRQINENNKRK
jgi:calcineurin-like phosphoesterase family protein